MDYGEIKMFCVWFVPNLVVCENWQIVVIPAFMRAQTLHIDNLMLEKQKYKIFVCDIVLSLSRLLALSFSLSLNEIN